MATELLYIDLFCGAGGTSTGVERACLDGRKCARVIACVNHDANAILSHAANHPHTRHFTEDIRTLDLGPLKEHTTVERMKNPDAKVVLWASLECTNHSRAKGGMSRDADSRTLAEHLFRYIEELQPDYIQIENVVEFMEWGPLQVKVVRNPETGAESCPLDIKHDRKRKQTTVAPVWIPDPEQKGTLYRKWVEEVCARGYRFDHRVLNSADFGAYTSRVRYFGLFARGGLPMVWPQPTHARKPTADMFGGSLKPWRAVRDVLDFDDRGESIFTRRKSLVDATLDRIHAGLVKFVAGGQDAFLVKWNSVNGKTGKYIAPDLDAPCPTVATQNRLGVARVNFLSKQFGGDPQSKNIGVDGQTGSVDAPCGALLTNPKQNLVSEKFLLNPQYRSAGGSVDAPCFTLIARMDKRPPYLVEVEQGQQAWEIRAEDTPAMRRIKEFCALYGIVDVTMRMLRISEMKRIQGFGDDYVLVGTQEEQKKYLGNAVVTQVATAMCEALAGALSERTADRVAS